MNPQNPQKPALKAPGCMAVVVFLIVVFGLISFFKEEKPPGYDDETYESAWREDTPIKISRVLAANSNVGNCGCYKYKRSTSDPDKYVVYCSPDCKKWKRYIVYPKYNTAQGPYQPDPRLK